MVGVIALSLPFYFLANTSVEDLIVDTVSKTSKLPRFMVHFYFFRVARVDPQWRSPTGQNLIQFTAAGVGKDPGRQKMTFKVIEHLIKNQVGVNEYAMGFTPLHDAVLYNHPELVAFLLKNGADPALPADDPSDQFSGMTPLDLADFLMDRRLGNFDPRIRDILRFHGEKDRETGSISQ